MKLRIAFSLISVIFVWLYAVVPNCTAKFPEGDSLGMAISRADSVFSGRLNYTLNQSTQNAPDKYELVLMGSSWKRRQIQDASEVPLSVSPAIDKLKVKPPNAGAKPEGQLEIVEMSHNGLFINYQSCPQPDKTIKRMSRVATGEKSPNEQFPPFPHTIGSFWFASTKEFVTANRASAIHIIMAKDNNGTDVFDYPVRKEDAYSAFHSVNELTINGGVLRIHISPVLGGAVTKIEHRGANGVGAILESSDFFRVNGVSMPRKGKLQYLTKMGPTFTAEYNIFNISDINESIEEKEFILELPVGTTVTDSRGGKGSKFYEITEPDSIPADMQGIYAPARSGAGWLSRWWWAVAIGAFTGVNAGLAIWLLRRRKVAKG